MRSERNEHEKAKANFLRLFPKNFRDPAYIERERKYKEDAHKRWQQELGEEAYHRLLNEKNYEEIRSRLIRVYGNLNLLSQFELMALSDALKDPNGGRSLSHGIFDLIYGKESDEARFNQFSSVLDAAPQKKIKLSKWPIQTIFQFLARPDQELFVKPLVTKRAAKRFGFELNYQSTLNWTTYRCALDFGQQLKEDLADWRPRDMIDIQSFIWVTNSEGYAEELI
jgi:hypothetical protein